MFLSNKKILVTGSAGFIGSALVKKLLEFDVKIVGIDNVNNYYSQELKRARLLEIVKKQRVCPGLWEFYEVAIEDSTSLKRISSDNQFDIVIHLAAQAGVRNSLNDPKTYIKSNLVGFENILELCLNSQIENFIYASSSSVYGGNRSSPFKEDDNVNHPVSLYAATKRANELMAHTFSHLYKIPSTGLRFFTVYGPWGRPDMAPMIFTKSILSKKPISVFNHGDMSRDFTYIDDVVEGIIKCCCKPATVDLNVDLYNPNPSSSLLAPFRIFNIGNSKPVKLLDFIKILEEKIGIKAIKKFYDMQPGDVNSTHSDNMKLREWVGYEPKTSLDEGIKKFLEWYFNYFKH